MRLIIRFGEPDKIHFHWPLVTNSWFINLFYSKRPVFKVMIQLKGRESDMDNNLENSNAPEGKAVLTLLHSQGINDGLVAKPHSESLFNTKKN